MTAGLATRPASDAELESLLAPLHALAARWSGFRADAIHPEAIRRATLLLLKSLTPGELLARATAGDRAVVQVVCESVSVGETYFFRHPEHFELLARRYATASLADYPGGFRAWCAGCATGEEAYSVAALLKGQLAWRGIDVAVLGTDLSPRSLATAARGLYRPWSVRDSGPLLYPVLEPRPDGSLEILAPVKQVTTFAQHNLLDGPRPGPFDLVFCRNVLIYFDPPAVAAVVARLTTVLAPGGILVLGTMDTPTPPPGLVRLGPDGVNVFARPTVPAATSPPAPARTSAARPAHRRRTPLPAPAPAAANQLGPAVTAATPIEDHLRALALIESGHREEAAALLASLQARAPGYLPALFERALLHQRAGELAAARTLVRELLHRTDGLPESGDVPGPEVLPVSYYRTAALALLEGRGRGGR